jgi:RNA polymerase sigma factor (TIGR02999 family)
MGETPHGTTQLLVAWSNGDARALEELTPLVYKELHRLAKRYMAGELRDHTLQSTALVNEAYLRLIDWKNVRWQNRAHFVGVAAGLMRRILVDAARSRRSAKRDGAIKKVALEDVQLGTEQGNLDLLALDDALTRLSKIDQRKCSVVEMRFSGGLTAEETAEILKVSTNTVLNDWSFAKSWLLRELSRQKP